jgi:hypothetical protein
VSGLLRRDFDVFDPAGRRGDWSAILTQALQVKLDSFADLGFDFLYGGASGHTAREVRNVRRENPW